MLDLIAGNAYYAGWLTCQCWLANLLVVDGYAAYASWPCCLDMLAIISCCICSLDGYAVYAGLLALLGTHLYTLAC
jgi:hypothetical protein